ncbi:P-loop containing nucleoside triphosphate hydrolase protein [Aspergillus recurvatus]
MSTHLALGTSAAACAVAVLLSVPHGYSFITQRTREKSYTVVEPECDEVTISGKCPRSLWQRVCLVAVGVVAATAALWSWMSSSTAIAATQVLQCASWTFTLFQEIVLSTRRNPAERYSLGCYSALANIPIAMSISLPYAVALHRGEHLFLSDSHHASNVVQLVAALVLLVVNLSLPRGPSTYRDGRIVDAQDSSSFLDRYTFSWAYRTLSLAARNGRLNPEDLPLVAEEVRAKTLSDRFFSTDPASVQWRKWLKLYWRYAAVQLTIQLCNAVVSFLPNVLLLTILRLFEDRDAGANNQLQLWLTALALGMSMVATAWLVALRDFIADLKISLPVNQQLFAVISKKALRLRDIAVPAQGSPDGADESEDAGEENDSDDDKPPQTKHSILNLLGVDVEKVSDFIAYSHLLLDCVVESILTTAFLVYLMGWKATSAGCAIPLLLTPLYYNITKRYSEKEQALMDRRDEKSASLTEMIHGIRQIKFSALEAEWFQKIQKLRGKELDEQRKVFWLNIILNGMYTLVPIFMSCFSIATYVYLNGSISPSTAFTALSLFETLRNTICILPEVVTEFLDARVSLARIAKFLGLEEHADGRSPGGGNGISLDHATIAWPCRHEEAEGEIQFQLKDLNLVFPSQELSLISGRSGSGKSLLLQALIGEADIVKGTVAVPRPEADPGPASPQDWIVNGMIAYVSQDPWIENATIRDSILFGLPFNPARYADVLYSCALLPDLKTLPDGDKTDIGANGINLSGGQKWRLALARALYSRASILVLDDIFSAVDAHVGRHLFDHALTGPLANGRTRILATHHVKSCLDGAAYLVKLGNGRVGRGQRLKTFEKATPETPDSSGPSTRPSSPNPSTRLSRREPVSIGETKKFYEEEKRETGVIKARVYKAYIHASGGYIPWLMTAVFLIVLLLLNLAIPYWVSIWTRSYETNTDGENTLFAQPGDRAAAGGTLASRPCLDERLVVYGSIYLAMSFGSWILEIIRIGIILHGSLKASKAMFEQFTTAILHAPLRFLDTTPAGQILNRFTSDFGTLDSDLALDLSYTLHDAITVLGVIAAALVTSPLVVGLGILSLGASWTVGYFYVTGAREAKRLESTAKSPIFELVGSLLTGLPTIRAFGREQAYLKRMYDLIDTHCQALWHRKLFASWRAIWLSLVGAAFVAAVTMIFVGIRTLDAPLAGFALSFALDMSSNVTWLLSQYASLEIHSNAAERIAEYTRLEQEPQSGVDVPAAWPSKGEIEISGLTVAYAPDLPPVLRNLNLCFGAGERVGVVGRTGAGKSSFAMTLLRCLDVREGNIHIDDVDIGRVKLRDLRERVGLISQDPIVFAGTVREVLDPFNQHDDTELLAALDRVGLSLSSTSPAQPPIPGEDREPRSDPSSSPAVTVLQLSLSTPIATGGKNLSQGQRQLLCLARALVSRPKILIMDEATASIDVESDQRIQQVLREDICGAGWGCTLIVIAHRLSTIADFDRVVVLERGEVVEMDSPGLLMGVEDGVFRGMVEGSGERGVVEGMILRKARV